MSTTITVTSAAELNQALSQAQGGETILLAAGDYGTLNLKNALYASNVTIKSADPSAMASFSEVYVNQTSNVTFDTIEFDYTYSSGQRESASKFRIDNSTNINIVNSVFDGDFASGTGTSADGTGFGKGLVVEGSANVTIANSEFHSWWKALNVGTSSDVDLIGNNIHTIRSDGINLGRVDGVLIENNYIHDFGGAAGSHDHRDMIQIKRSSGDGSSDIIIRNNVLDMGAGDYTQGIWAGGDNANYSDPTDWHQDIVIEGNIIYNAHTNGIALHMTDGLTISNNTLIAVPRAVTGGVTIPKITVGSSSTNVIIDQNVTSGIAGHQGQSDWTVLDNAFVQNTNPSGPGYYDTQFVYHATSATDGYNQFSVVPGSTVDVLGAGSDLVDGYPFSYDSWVGTATTPVTGGTGTSTPPSSGTSGTGTGTTPDAGAGTTPDAGTGTTPDAGTGTTPDAGAGTTPDAGAGTTPDAGSGTTPDAGAGSTPSTPSVPTSQMVFDDFVLDIANLSTNGQAKLVGDATVVDTASGPVIQFDGNKDLVKFGRLTEFEDSEQIAFTVEFTRAEADGSVQRLVWNKGHVGLTLTGDGLIAHAANNDGKFTKGFYVKDLGLNDTETHTITFMVDQNADRLQVLVDGDVVLDETNTDFDFVDAHGGKEWGWDLGFARNRYIDGEVSAFAIDDEVVFVDTALPHDDFSIA